MGAHRLAHWHMQAERREPQAYITSTLRKILDQLMQSGIDDLMPWNFAK